MEMGNMMYIFLVEFFAQIRSYTQTMRDCVATCITTNQN